MRVLSVWNASATMSHISRMWSRMSSGNPLSGRSMANRGRPRSLARSSALALSTRMRSMRFSTSRTLVRYSSSLALSSALTLRLKARGLILDTVENALVPAVAAVLEEAVESQRGIDFHRHGRVGALPGNVRAVGHREIRLVITGDGLLAAEHQAGLHRVLPEVIGQHLIHADAAPQHRALHAGACRKGCCRSAPDECPRPLPVLLNRPVMTFILRLKGASGSRLLPSSISAPAPFAHQ